MGGRAVPKPTPETAPYWEAAARGELMIQRCGPCAQFYFYPRLTCPRCGSSDVSWVTASGRASLHTYLITHVAAPGFEEDVPMAIAVVTLEEGPRMMTNIVDIEQSPESLVLDMPLEVTFRQRDGVSIPVFRPRGRG